jgi:hypothetical protein
MGVPTSEVGYSSATTGRGNHAVHDGHVVALDKKNIVTSWWWTTSKPETCRGVVTQYTEDKWCINLASLHANSASCWSYYIDLTCFLIRAYVSVSHKTQKASYSSPALRALTPDVLKLAFGGQLIQCVRKVAVHLSYGTVRYVGISIVYVEEFLDSFMLAWWWPHRWVETCSRSGTM